MSIHFNKNFQKNYKRRIKPFPKQNKKFKQKIAIFHKNPHSPLLKNHKLKGTKQNLYSISITGDIRAIYTIKDKNIYFIDIGTHNQVY